MTTRHFTRRQLEEIGVPFELDGDDTCASMLSTELIGSERWTDVHRLVFRAPDDGKTYQVDYETGSTEHQDGIDPWHRWGKTIPAVEVEQRPVTVMQWMPVPPAVEEQPAVAESEACGKCKRPFDPTDTRFDGLGQYASTPYCRRCVDACRDNEIADHRCVICA